MSYVTTVVIFGRYIPREAQEKLREGYHAGERLVSFGDLSEYRSGDPCSPWNIWGGTKGPESDVFGGAFNFLDDESLLTWLRTLPWYGRVAVLFGHQEGDQGFVLETLGEDSRGSRG